MSTHVTVDRPQESTVVVTLNRPEKRNALSVALRDELTALLDELAADESVKALVITGAGDVFCAGFDLTEFDRALEDPAFAQELWGSSDRYHRRLATFPVPAIAAVRGPAVAGGLDLAVLCDLRVASTNARFSHPEYTFGDVVYTPLADLVGGARARELCLTGRVLHADEALRWGLVNAVVAPEAVLEEALRLAEAVGRAPRANLMRTKAKALSRGALPAGGTLDL